jgi:6-phosphogluconate dehydrogenase (decarboxylating)
MQIGMVGLGRMGANMIRRLTQHEHVEQAALAGVGK